LTSWYDPDAAPAISPLILMANQCLNIAPQYLFRAALFALATLADVFFWLLFILTAYCWLFFKGQTTGNLN